MRTDIIEAILKILEIVLKIGLVLMAFIGAYLIYLLITNL